MSESVGSRDGLRLAGHAQDAGGRRASRPGSAVRIGGLVIFTIHVNLILNILDLYSFIVIYCDYWKVE